MGYWKSFGVVSSFALASLVLVFVAAWQLYTHPVVTGIILLVALILLFISLMAAVWA